jgi:hypothetical protein
MVAKEIDLDALQARLRTIRAGMSRSVWSELLADTVAALLVEETGYIVDSTKPADLLFGYVPGELAGQPLKVVIPERFWDSHDKHWLRYWEHPIARAMGSVSVGGPGRKLEIVGRLKDGNERDLSIALHPFKPKETDKRVALALISERF